MSDESDWSDLSPRRSVSLESEPPLLDQDHDDDDPIDHGNVITDDEDDVETTDTPDMATPIDLNLFDDADANAFALDFVHVSHIGPYRRESSKRYWDLFRRHNPSMAASLPSYDTFERKLKDMMPQPKCMWKVKHLVTNKYFSGTGDKFPEKVYGDRDTYEVMQVWSRLRLQDVIRLHAGTHLECCEFVTEGRIEYNNVHLSITCDGIPNGRGSSQDNLNLISIHFRGCRLVYVIQVRVAKRKELKDVNDFFESLVKECNDLGVHVDYFLADAPMRAFAKRLKGHAGRHSCETCEARGVCVNRKIVYPASTVMQVRRTKDRWMDCVKDLERQRVVGLAGGSLTDNVKGVMGRSPLLELHSFNIVDQAPTDPLHRDWLGIVKGTLWKHTMGMGKGHMSARGTRVTNAVSEYYRSVRLPEEFSHRSRAIDYANFKGHEWKTLIMTSFVALCDAVQEEMGHKLAHIWISFVFLVLVYYGPEWLFYEFDQEYLHNIHEAMYDDFEMEFGPGACSYNWHAFYHMPIVRRLGRMCHVSTEPFESAYGAAQGSYHSGTRNIGMQIVRNMLVRCAGHTPKYCSNRLHMEPERELLRSDNSILLDNLLQYYKVLAVHDDDVTVKRMKTKNWECHHDPTLPFHLVGVVVFTGDLDDQQQRYPKTYFKGKGVLLPTFKLLVPLYWDLIFS